MHELTEEEILSIAEKLPSARGYSDAEISAVESALVVQFPPTYRRLLRSAGLGMASSGLVLPISDIEESTRDATEILTEDGYDFRLQQADIVFAWADIYAFYFFAANGSDDVPVYEFNYNSNTTGQPTIYGQNVPQAFALFFRQLWRRIRGG